MFTGVPAWFLTEVGRSPIGGALPEAGREGVFWPDSAYAAFLALEAAMAAAAIYAALFLSPVVGGALFVADMMGTPLSVWSLPVKVIFLSLTYADW